VSTDDQPDLRAVRALTRPRTATTPDELQRLRHRIVHARPRAPRRRTRAWLVPGAAAAVALALIAGVTVALNRPENDGPGLAPMPSGSAELGATRNLAATFTQLRRAAAGTKPVAAEAGDQLHRRDVMLVPGPGPEHRLIPQVHDTWYDLQGLIAVRELSDGNPVDAGPKGESQTDLDRADFAAKGPGVTHPTPAWLAGLSDDPVVLLHQLGLDPPMDAEATQALWYACSSLMTLVDPLLRAGVRVALLQVLERVADLTATDVTVGGQRMIGLELRTFPTAELLLFDPRTAHLTGRVGLTLSGAGPSPTPGTVGSRPSAGTVHTTMQWLYGYEVVPG
jgi:hypothetical protein